MRLSGTSPPATSFQNRPLTMFLKNSSVNGLSANIQFSNFRVRPKFVNNYVNYIKNVKFRLIWPFKTFPTLRLSSKILLFVIRRTSAWPFAYLLEKCGLEVDQNGLDLFFVSRLSKIHFLHRFYSLTTKLCCFLCSITLFFVLGFTALVFNLEQNVVFYQHEICGYHKEFSFF